ncbi:MAG: bis-aminopropyl spermidine synthase family protein [Dehalococcoidia bacterium]|nr:bis-aminopropyl spermidine synthase family protein [Dehalococcoidia bacterium]
MNALDGVIEAVSLETGLECSEADLNRVLSAFMSGAGLWDAIGLSGRPFALVLAIGRQLERRGLLVSSLKGTHLTHLGKKLCVERGLRLRRRYRCRSCEGRSISLAKFRKALERFEVLAAERPEPVQEFDQAYVTPETTMARLALMADRGDLAGKDLLVLGDDDLMGLGAALTGLPKRVVVVEIDGRLTDFMSEAARVDGLSLQVMTHDLAAPLPPGLAGSFDTFFTDPPDAQGGMRLFLSRAIEGLRGPGMSGYFGLTMIESSLYRWRELQEYLVRDCGVVVTDVISDFSTYVNWDYLGSSLGTKMDGLLSPPKNPWYRSALYRIELLPGSKPRLDGLDREGLYVGKESLAWTKDTEVGPMLEEPDTSNPETLQEVENTRRGDG